MRASAQIAPWSVRRGRVDSMPKLEVARFLALVGFLVIVGAAPAQSQVFVSEGGDDAKDCLSPAEACKTIARGMQAAPSHAKMYLLPGRYVGFEINEAIHIRADPGAVIWQGAFFCGGINAAVCITAPAG